MIKRKRIVAVITAVCVSIAMFSICPVTLAQTTDTQIIGTEEIKSQEFAMAASVSATTNASTPIRMAPVTTADVVETLSANYSITIIEREYEFLYIQYVSGGITKRGYMPRANTNTTTGFGWCEHTIFDSGYNNSANATSVHNVYYLPGGTDKCGEIYGDEGETANNTLIVLRQQGAYYFIQYITNTTNNGGQPIKWKRGWVPASIITVSPVTSFTGIGSKTKFYIQNVGTGRYLDVPSYNAVDGANIHIWDFHGGYNQEWVLTPRTTSTGSTYVTITTCQKNSTNTEMVLAVKDALSIINTRIDLAVKGDPPSKDQEFYIEKVDGTTDQYYINSRLTGNYLQFGVYHDQTGNGGPVLNKYPYTTAYNRWRLIPVYEEGVDYEYNYDYTSVNSIYPLVRMPSDIANGVSVSFDISSIVSLDNDSQYSQYSFYQATVDALTTWSAGNRLIAVSADPSSQHRISYSVGEGDYLGVASNTYYSDPQKDNYGEIYDSFISINYTGIKKYADTNGYSYSNVWQSVVAHELGHTLGLEDLLSSTYPTAYTSLMSYHRDRNAVVGPSNSDVAAVKKLYMNGGN